jgi:hypothetical protein
MVEDSHQFSEVGPSGEAASCNGMIDIYLVLR